MNNQDKKGAPEIERELYNWESAGIKTYILLYNSYPRRQACQTLFLRGMSLMRVANTHFCAVYFLSEVPTPANTHYSRYGSYPRCQPSQTLILRGMSFIGGTNPRKYSFCAINLLSEVTTLANTHFARHISYPRCQPSQDSFWGVHLLSEVPTLANTHFALIGSANPRKYSVCVVHVLSEVPTLANKLFAQYRYISYARCQLPTLVNNDERGGEPILSRYRNII